MDPFVKKLKWGGNPLVTAVIGIVVVAGAAVVGYMALGYNSYKQAGGLPPVETAPAQIAISYPQNGGEYEAGESLIVEATAVGPVEFVSVELWLDGKLVGMQTAPEGGLTPFSTHFSWLPLEPGSHSLIAGAVDANGQKAMSAQVIVFIVSPEDGSDILTLNQTDSPTVLPAPPEEANGAPASPGAGDSSGPAGSWSGSPGDWLNSLTAGEGPTAPELVATPGQCAANLLIHDLSDNEEGFIVYRQTLNSPSWLKVATLSSQSQVEWLEYTDEGISGAVTYYVSAFNSQGTADSNLQLVNIPMDDCGQDGAGIGVGSVDVTLQIPNQEAEKVYCYFSTDGANWARWPQFGFLMFDENGSLPSVPVVQVRQTSSGEEPAFPLLNLLMDCWGWQGGELTPLGNFSVEELSPQMNGGQAVVGEGISAQVMYSPLNLENLFPFELGSDWIGDTQMIPMHFHQEKLTPIHPDIARVFLNLVTDPQECINYLPDKAKNPLGALLYCFPYPQFDATKGGTPPQPYLGWTWNPAPKCLDGWSESCLGYPELLKMAEETGGQIGFEVAAMSNRGQHSWIVTEPWLRMFVVPPVSCAGDMQFNVRLWYQPGNEGVAVSASPDSELMESDEFILSNIPHNEVLYGPFSNPVTIPCQPMSVNVDGKILFKQYLDVTFKSIEMFEVDDGDSDSLPEQLELYGHFKVYAPSMGELTYPEDHCVLPESLPCDDDDMEYLWEEPYYAHRRRFLNVGEWESSEVLQKYLEGGFYNLRDWDLCQSTYKYGCLYEGQSTSHKTNNNTLRVFVAEGDALTLEVALIDYDSLSDDDHFCFRTLTTPSLTLEQWANVQNKTYMLYGDMTFSGRCTVEVVINAVEP
jgi:hypothetical protein